MSSTRISWYPLFVISVIIFLDSAGYGVIVPIIPDFVNMMGLSPIEVSSLYTVYGFVLFVLPVPFGIIADRVDRKTFLYIGLLGKALALFGFTIVESYWGLLLFRTIDAFAGTATWTVGLALVADFYPQETIGAKYGIAMAAGHAGSSAGPLLGGPAADYFGDIAPPFYIMSLLCVLAAGFVVFMQKPGEIKPSKSPSREMRSLLRNREVVAVGLLFLLGAGFIAMMEPLYPVYMHDVLKFSRTRIGLVFALITGTIILFMPITGALSSRLRPRILIIAGLLITGVTAPGLVIIKSTAPLFCCMFLHGIGWALMLAPSFPLFTQAVRKAGAQFGIAFGLSNAFFAAGFMIGPSIGGPLAQYLGIIAPFVAFSAVLLVMVYIFVRFVGDLKIEKDQPGQPVQ